MEKNVLKKRNINGLKKLYLIIALVLLIAIGYSFIQNTFSFEGLINIHRDPFEVYLDNVNIKDGSKEAIKHATINSSTKKSLGFEVNFNDPLDYYTFYVDIVNSGKIDAMISNFKISGISDTIKPYIVYSMTYDDGKEIKVNDLIKAGTRDTVKFDFRFDESKNLIDIFGPNANFENLDLDIKFDFIEANDSGVLRDNGILLSDILKNKGPVLDNIASKFVSSSTGIDFKSISSKSNGNGLYIRGNTASNEYPIYYYRGDVDDNNIIFADKCWKIVRTTNTGGTKLIYNGTPNYKTDSIDQNDYSIISNDATYPYIFDSTTKKWISSNHDDGTTSTIEFSIKNEGEYYFNYAISCQGYWDEANLYIDGVLKDTFTGLAQASLYLGRLTSDSKIKITYVKDTSNSRNNDTISFSLGKKNSNSLPTCNNTGVSSQISATPFNSRPTSLTSMGYVYSENYSTYTGTAMSSTLRSTANIIYANDVTWDGTNYTLSSNTFTSTGTWSKDYTSVGNAKHYTCLQANTSTCSTVYYVYYVNSSLAYYIPLTGGKNVDNAIADMLPSENTARNRYNSIVKQIIDPWYKNNLSKYTTDYIEDTIWCNDREFDSYGGWNKDNNSRYNSTFKPSYHSDSGTPFLECSNAADSFSTSSIGNARLTYPVGMLTFDEILLSGALETSDNSDTYLYTGEAYWTMSPYFFRYQIYMYSLTANGKASGYAPSTHLGIRPAISLNKNVKINGGDGSIEDPYKIKTIE